MMGSNERRDPWLERVSEYLDDELSSGERRAFERHEAGCAECRASVAALRQVATRAETLKRAVDPPSDLWPGIAERLTPRQRKPAFSWSPFGNAWLRPQVALAAALVLVAFLAAAWLLHLKLSAPPRQIVARPPAVAPTREIEHDRDYEKTVAHLEREARRRLTLDPHVVEVLDENLATLDAAIATYSEALAEQPRDGFLRERLKAARDRKLEVLQQAVSLTTEGTE